MKDHLEGSSGRIIWKDHLEGPFLPSFLPEGSSGRTLPGSLKHQVANFFF
jgi:hypothetical protein